MNVECKFPETFRTCTVTDSKRLEQLRTSVIVWNMRADQLDKHCCKERRMHQSEITQEIASNVLSSYTVTEDIARSLKDFSAKMENNKELCVVAIDARGCVQSIAIISTAAHEIILLAGNSSNLKVPGYPLGKQVRGASLAVISHIFHLFPQDSTINAEVHRSALNFYERLGFVPAQADGDVGGVKVKMQSSVKETLDILAGIPLQTTRIQEAESGL